MSVKYPTDSNTLKSAGFVYDNDAACRGCGVNIEWWITPGGKKIPMSTVIVGSLATKDRAEMLQPHFTDCPNAGDFRRKA